MSSFLTDVFAFLRQAVYSLSFVMPGMKFIPRGKNSYMRGKGDVPWQF